jgi:type II secretory pathway component GspD/PulD (secretin)
MSSVRRSSAVRTLGALAVTIAVSLGAMASREAVGQEAPEEKVIQIDAKGMAVKAYLQILSEKGGFTFIDEAGIEGEITLTAQSKLTRTEALEVLRTWLNSRARGIIRTGNIVRIMTLEEIRKHGGIKVIIGFDPKAVPETEEIVTQVVILRRLKAADVVTELRGLLTADAQLYRDQTANALVITDTQNAIHRLLTVIEPLDRSPSLEVTIKPFPLKNANADDVAQIIKDLYPKRTAQAQQGGGPGGANNPFAGIQRIFGGNGGGPGGGGGGGGGGRGGGGGGGGRNGGGGGGQDAASNDNSDVNVSVDKRSNTVIVSASVEQLKVIEPLVSKIDEFPSAATEELRSFHLVNASPIDLSSILTDIFAQQTGQQQQQGGQGGGAARFFAAMQGSTDATAIPRNAPQPRFTVDARTNSLVVSAVQVQMRIIENLVKELDQDSTYRQSVLVVPLKNGDATNIAKVLTDLLNAATTQRAPQQGGGAQARGSTTTALAELAGDVKIVADADSNSLVVTTTPKNFTRIKQMITDLDRPRRQVLLETLIAEITLDSAGDLGVQWSTNWIRDFATNQVGGTSAAAANLGLGALTNGFTLTSTSNKASMLIHALQTDGKLNVLSSPKILTLENQAAELSVGQDVPFITNSRVTTNGDTVNTVQYRTVGVILKVTPKMNEAGDVRMVVHPEVSQIGPQSEAVPISNGVTSPVFERTFADTTIVVRDGETAIIGGMIRNELTETVQKLPIIGDIPLVGLAFRYKTSDKKKIELVVFMTPHLIDTPEQLRRRTKATNEKFVLVPPEMLQDELDRWTRGLEEDSAISRYNRGTVYMEQGRIPEAIEELSRARDKAPRDAATRFNLGLAYAKAGDLDRAAVELHAASEIAPRDAEAHYNLGAVLWRRADYAGAAAELKLALEIDPSHDDARLWLKRAEAANNDVPGLGKN